MGFFKKNKQIPLTVQLLKQSWCIEMMMADELRVSKFSLGLFKKGAFYKAVAAVYNADTWVSYSSEQAASLDMVGQLAYPLEVMLEKGGSIVYDMDEASAQQLLQVLKKQLGDKAANVRLERRTKQPLAEFSFSTFGQENFLRVFDSCIHIRKTKSMNTRGGIGDLLKLGMQAAGMAKGQAHELIIPYSDVRQVILEPPGRLKLPVLTVLRKSRPNDGAPSFFDMNDRLDCWTFDREDYEDAQRIGMYIYKQAGLDG